MGQGSSNASPSPLSDLLRSPVPFDGELWLQLLATAPNIQPKDYNAQILRKIRVQQPQNFAILIYKLVHQLVKINQAVKGDRAAVKCNETFVNIFTMSTQQSSTALPVGDDTLLPSRAPVVSSLIHLLTALLSVAVEQHEWQQWLWGHQQAYNTYDGRTMAQVLLLLNVDLMFLSGFTITSCTSFSSVHLGVQLSRLWQRGCGPPMIAQAGAACNDQAEVRWDQNRIDVIRMIIVLCSEGMYDDAGARRVNRSIMFLGSSASPLSPTMVWSLVNLLTYNPRNALAYSYGLYCDVREALLESALHLLLLFLDERDGGGVFNNDSSNSSSEENQLYRILIETNNPNTLTHMFEYITKLIINAVEANNTYMPGSLKRLQCFDELCLLLWKLCDENPNFIPHILSHCDILPLMSALFVFMWESRAPSSFGMLYTCVFILLKLSGEREFGCKLSVAITNQNWGVTPTELIPLPLINQRPHIFAMLNIAPIPNATYADILLFLYHQLIVSSPNHLDALLKVILTTICNISPYISHLSLPVAVKLLNLFELFSSPKFLYSSPNHPHYITLLLDILNNLLQYQYAGNANLVYAILRRANGIIELSRLVIDEEEESHIREQKPIKLKDVLNVSELDPSKPFQPTAKWVNAFKRALPLDVIMALLEHFESKVEQCVNWSEQQIIDMIASSTLVGILPLPHPICLRRYVSNIHTNAWFSSYLFGTIFLRQQLMASYTWHICYQHYLYDGSLVSRFQAAASTTSQAPSSQQGDGCYTSEVPTTKLHADAQPHTDTDSKVHSAQPPNLQTHDIEHPHTGQTQSSQQPHEVEMHQLSSKSDNSLAIEMKQASNQA